MLTTLLSTASAQAAGGPGSLALASDIAELVIAGAMLVLALLGVLIFFRINAILKDIRQTAQQSLGPVSDRARAISDNVEFITQAVRTDVEKLNASVRTLSDRLQFASDRMEERIEEFNALMEVVQGEAEDVFLDTASTVRGVREGARAITERARTRQGPEDGPSDVGDEPGALGPSDTADAYAVGED
jgi:hypothetical protein